MTHLRSRILLVCLGIATLWFGCKSSKAPVNIIEGNPKAASADTSLQSDRDRSDVDFMQLTMGELHPIKSMDPLFASNTSNKRFIQHIYEGLVRYDESGKVVPAIAADWQISDDSLTYRFTLRSNVYYHDHDVFSAGTGQRVISRDFHYIFKRMARLNVPPDGAKLFMAVEGFESYYREQRQLYDPEDRRLDGITGIKTPTDTTLVFELREQDPHFLHKLATPYAVVYPREAVSNTSDNKMITEPVGSGPFQFSKRENDSTYILSRFEGYWQNRGSDQNIPRLNRIDILHRSPQTLYQEFTDHSIDLIPELGPYTGRQAVDSSGQLSTTLADKNYQLYRGGTFTYRLLYNSMSSLDRKSIHRELNTVNFQQIASDIHPYMMKIDYKETVELPESVPRLSVPIEIPFSDDPYIKHTVQQIKQHFQDRAVDLRISNIRVPVESTGLIAEQAVPLYPQSGNSLDAMTLIRFNVHHLGLAHSNLQNLIFNPYPWWLDLRQTRITNSESSI